MKGDYELYHYGVKGMKWGVRRAVRRDESVKKAREQYNRDFDDAAKAARKTKTFAVTKRGKTKKQQRAEEYNKAYNKMVESQKKLKSAESKARQKAEKTMQSKKKSSSIKKNDKVTNAYKANIAVNGINAVNSLLSGDALSAAWYARSTNRYRKGMEYYRDVMS